MEKVCFARKLCYERTCEGRKTSDRVGEISKGWIMLRMSHPSYLGLLEVRDLSMNGGAQTDSAKVIWECREATGARMTPMLHFRAWYSSLQDMSTQGALRLIRQQHRYRRYVPPAYCTRLITSQLPKPPINSYEHSADR
jgi:hypothetical protein